MSATPLTLALDFDGVLCDGLKEYFQSAWRTYRQVWLTSNSAAPDDLASTFYRLRPVIETGWEMPVLLRAILKGFPAIEILENWPGIRERVIAEEDLSPSDIGTRLDAVRDRWITDDLAGWLKLHQFFAGVPARLQELIDPPLNLFIITTKEGRFVQQLLAQIDIQLPTGSIFGKECDLPKHETLRTLTQEYPIPLWFVEDRLQTLSTIKEHGDLQEVRLFLAHWGYNTPAEQAQARQDERIKLLSLAQFGQDFDAWLQSN